MIMKKQKLLVGLFSLYPLLDLISSLQLKYVSFNVTLGILIKGLLVGLLFFYAVVSKNSKYRLFTIVYGATVSLFTVGFFIFHLDLGLINSLEELTHIFRIFSLPIMMILLLNLFQDIGIDLKTLKRVLCINGLLYMLLLALPLIIKTANYTFPLQPYLNGYMGLFTSSLEVSTICIMLYPFIYRNIYQSYSWSILILVTTFVYLMIGTKVVLFGIILTSLYYVIISFIKKQKRVLSVILLIGVLLISFFSPAVNNMIKSKDWVDESSLIALISNEEDRTNPVVVENFNYDNLKPDQLLFGIGVTEYDISEIHNDFLNIYYTSGIIGTIIFIIPLIFVLSLINRKLFEKFSLLKLSCLIIIGMALLLAIYSGQVLYCSYVNIYLVLIALLLLTLSGYINDVHVKKVMYIATTGGHLTEILALKPLFKKYDTVLVTEGTKTTKSLKKKYNNVYYLLFGSDRHNIFIYGLRLLVNSLISLYIYVIEMPDVIISTGAHFAGPMLCIGKIVDSKIIFIETLANTSNRSKTGSIVYKFADLFIVRWDSMLSHYKKAIKRGGVK